jgi:RHS repeat-associated protein
MFSLCTHRFQSLFIVPALLPVLFLFLPISSDNHPPVAADDTFTVHGCTTVSVTSNDSDPDNSPISVNGFPTPPAHASIFSNNGNGNLFYCPNNGYVGSDSFVYQLCDPQHACANATVTLDVANQAPNGVTDFYNIHGFTVIGPFLANDSDPDGDGFTCGAIGHNCIQTLPQHGTLNGVSTDHWAYTPTFAYTGSDSLTYNVCDGLGLCTETTVNLSVNNNPPIALPDVYLVPGPFTPIGPFMRFAFDPDNDTLRDPEFFSFPQHGTTFPSTQRDKNFYTPNAGFSGLDSFTYRVCDSQGGCSPVVGVYLIVLGNGDGINNGVTSCNSSLGGPVNVTNGNMYLRQDDYVLRSVGYGIELNRTYNSTSQKVGLFGRGWSNAYDATVTLDNDNLAHLMQADGRVIYFWRSDANGPFSDLIGDLHQQLTQTGSGFTLTMKDGSAEQFNTAGRLLSLTDQNGNTTSLGYDINGFLAGITDPSGRTLTVNVNANGLVTAAADSLGTVATYTYGGSNELLSVTYADNSAYSFAYDGGLRLTTVTDALLNVVESHSYDSQGRATTSERQGGVDHYSFNYLSNTETDVTDGLGRITKYTIDKTKGRNVVTRVEGMCGCGGGNNSQVQTWVYDNQLNVTSKTDALNHVTTFTYDANGNPLTDTDETGTISYTYNGFAEVLTRTDQLNGVTTNTYDSQGNLLALTNALGKTTTFTYDARGLLLTVTDARGKATTFTYDGSGNLVTRNDALNHDTQFAYDVRGRLSSTTTALGFSTAFGYDSFGRLKLITRADGTTISYEYDLAGRRTAITDAKGNRSTFAYDGAYRLANQTDAANQTTSYGYDPMSNLTSVTDALGRTTNYDYDDFNRRVKSTYPAAAGGATRLFESTAYDADGNVTSRTDTAGRVTSYAYDNLNRVTGTTDPLNQTTTFEYDELSRMRALVDPIGQRYRFNYDAIGQLRHMRRGTDVMSFTYDPAGNRKSRTDYNGAETVYAYDALNRLKTITYPDTATVSYTYDKLSRLQTATNENGTVNFDYNKMNRVTTVTDVFGQVVDYNYDGNGNRTKLSLNSAIVQTYKYDTVNRLTKILDSENAAFTFDYDSASKLIQQKAPNNVKTTYQYDDLDRLTRITATKGANTIANFQYQFNDANDISQEIDPTGAHAFGYDLADRLTAATHSSLPSESYTYDGVGNRTSSQLSASYNYQRFNRLVSTTNASYVYDANGNLTSKTDSTGTTQFGWDFENRLRQVTLPNGNVVSYKYDAFGRRVDRTANLVSPLPIYSVTRFVYDGGEVIRDLDGNGATLADYINGLGTDNKLRQTTITSALYFVQDHLGSTRALTTSLGAVAASLNYDSFGNSSSSSLTRYTYTAREFDSDAGLYYYRARFYDPKVGRFISEDPIGFRGGVNQFAYVGNSPLNRRDPSGLYNIDVHYYLTYFIASRFPCLTPDEVRKIAEADQHTDEDEETSPGFGWNEGQRQINSDFHAFNNGNNGNLNNLRNIAFGRGSAYGDLGRYLHYLQDTFSHRGFGNSIIGQGQALWDVLSVDYTNHDVGKAAEMAGATWFAIRDWIKTKKCECGDQGDTNVEKWWPQVIAFLETDNDQLERKRRILGVPKR